MFDDVGLLLFIFVLFVGWLALSAGLLFLTVRSWHRVRSSQHWPSAKGKVIASGARKHQGESHTYYTIGLVYAYSVEGAEHRSKRVDFDVVSSYAEWQAAEQVLNRYPLGTEVDVFYNPDNPQLAVLERTVSGLNTALFLTGGVIAAGLGYWMIPLMTRAASEASWSTLIAAFEVLLVISLIALSIYLLVKRRRSKPRRSKPRRSRLPD